METADDMQRTLAAVGPRLRAARLERGVTLAALSAATGISVSTLSRLESGRRRASLELLLPLARAHQMPLDELVGAPEAGDPRVPPVPRALPGLTATPLSRHPAGPRAYRLVIDPARPGAPRAHEGQEWLYVLSGRLRLLLGRRDVLLAAGEAAEYDARVPHWFGPAGPAPVEVLSLFGAQGEQTHARARPASP